MTEEIRKHADSLFYTSAASTANVREQLIKLQQSAKLIRALSDASTVNTNGDKLQDILTGLSFGNSTQRHKYRALYDTTNDRYIIQRNSGTDASKTWVELLRIDSSGNVTTTGTLSTDSLTTTAGGVTLGGNLDANGFYVRNVDKYVGLVRTDSLLVHGTATFDGDITIDSLETIWIPASDIRPQTALPSSALTQVELTAFNAELVVLDFASVGSNDHAIFSVSIPRGWNFGTIEARFYWTCSSAVTTSVIWNIKGVAVGDNDTIDTGYGTSVSITDQFHGTANDMAVTSWGTFTVAGTPADGRLCYFVAVRTPDEAGDTMTQDARLIGVELRYRRTSFSD